MKLIILSVILIFPFFASAYEPNSHARSATEASFNQIEELKEQIKALRGDVEKLQFEYDNLNEKLNRFVSDTELRFNEIKQPNSIKPKQDRPSSGIDRIIDNALDETGNNKPVDAGKTGEDKKKISAGSIEDKYQNAYNLYKAGNHSEAHAAFQQFLADNPNTKFTGPSCYWLGEILYSQADYNKAALQYLKGYQAASKSVRAGDNLFKLAKSLTKLEKTREACTAFTKFRNEFPNASVSLKKQMEEEVKKLGCKP